MNNNLGEIKVFAAGANQELAAAIVAKGEAYNWGLRMGKSRALWFGDGESDIRIDETVRGADVFIVQSTAPLADKSVNDHLMELLVMIDAMRRSSAGRITAVIPYFGYARQDRRDRGHAPISAKLVADMLTAAGADRILSMDLHSPQIQGFFNIPFDHLSGVYTFANYFASKYDPQDLKENYVVVSPDFGSVTRCGIFAKKINGLPLAIVEKRRDPDTGAPTTANFIGDVKGKHAIILDDVLSSGSSLRNAAEEVVNKHGAASVRACVTHPVLSGNAVDILAESILEEVLVLDTIQIPPEKQHPKIKRLSVAELFSRAIHGIHHSTSIGSFDKGSVGELL